MRQSRWLSAVRCLPVLITLVAMSCTATGAKAAGVAPRANTAPTRLLVAIGGSDARGIGTDDPLRESWPQDLYRALPANYRLVNLGIADATLDTALTESLPTAESLRPALVAVWLNVNDILNQTPVKTYQAELSTLLHRLRATGATVLVANTPPLDQLPAYMSCADPAGNHGACSAIVPQPVPTLSQVAAAVTAYKTLITAVAKHEGAIVVDLHAAAVGSSLIANDGFNPNAAGAQLIATQFAAAVTRP